MVRQTSVEINKYGFPVVFMECGHHIICSTKWATAEEIVANVTAHIGMKQRCEECGKRKP